MQSSTHMYFTPQEIKCSDHHCTIRHFSSTVFVDVKIAKAYKETVNYNLVGVTFFQNGCDKSDDCMRP